MSDAATATAAIRKPERGAMPEAMHGASSTQVSVSSGPQKSSSNAEADTSGTRNERHEEDDCVGTNHSEASRLTQDIEEETKGGEAGDIQVGGERGVGGESVVNDEFDEIAEHGPSGWIECVDPWIDEVILQLVRDKQSGLGAHETIDEEFWENVAAALNQLSGGAVVVGESVRSRVSWLTSVFLDDVHEEFGKLTETMYGHLAAHLQFLSKRGPTQTELATRVEQSAKRRESQRTFVEPSSPSTQTHDEEKSQGVNEQIEQKQSAHGAQLKNRTKRVENIPSGRKSTFRDANGKAVVIPDVDEFTMELVIKYKRALSPDGVFVMPLWQKVADEVNLKKGPVFKNGRGAQSRVHWLVSVLNEPSHEENAKLTPNLRSHLKEYSDFGLKRRIRRLSASPGDTGSSGLAGSRSVIKSSNVENQLAPKATIDAAEDEKLFRLLLDKADLLLEIDRKMKVWNALAEASRGRFRSGWAVQQRVIFLTKVLNDPTHSEHSALSDNLREMIIEYSGYAERLRQQRAPASLTSSTPKSNGRADTASESNDISSTYEEIPLPKETSSSDEEEYLPILPKTHDKSAIDPEVDARILRLVLAKESAFMTSARRMQVWEEIAEESRGRYTSGWSAHGHVTWLLRVFNDPSTEQHSNLTETMRRLLAKVKKMYARMKESQVPSPGRGSKDAPKRTDKDVSLGESMKLEKAVTMTADKSMRTTGKGTVPGTSTKHQRRLVVKPKFDEMLTKLVITKLPFPISREERVSMWNAIADLMREKYPKIKSAHGVKTRFKWLLTVFKDPTHDEYPNLTKKLRATLTAFEGVNAPVTPRKSEGIEPETEELPRENEWTEEADCMVVEAALRFRPFRSKPGKRMDSWEQVAAQLNAMEKTKPPVTGHHCLYRMRKLLAVSQGRINTEDVRLTNDMRLMLGLLETLQKMKWPEADDDLSSKQRKLLAKVDKLLETGHNKSSSTHAVVFTKPFKTDVTPPPTEESKPSTAGTPASASKRKLKWDEHADESDVEIRLVPAKKHQPSPVREKQTTCVMNSDSLSESTALFQGLGQRIDEVCATVDRDRAALTAQLSALRKEFTSQSAAVLKKIELERKEHRAELQTLVEMLKADRETHNRETASMLEVITKEREDRREEFVAMMNLVTRTVLHHQQP